MTKNKKNCFNFKTSINPVHPCLRKPRSVCPISQSDQLNRLVSPMSKYEFSNVPINCYRTSISLSNIQISWSRPHLWVAVLGVGAVWTWWRGQPGIRDLYLWIKVSANHCHHHHRHHDHHFLFQHSYLQIDKRNVLQF